MAATDSEKSLVLSILLALELVHRLKTRRTPDLRFMDKSNGNAVVVCAAN